MSHRVLSSSDLSLRSFRTAAADPFGAYLALREELGDREAFLLESLAGPSADRRSAAIGFSPILEVSVLRGQITVTGLPALLGAVTEALLMAGAANGLNGPRLTSDCTIFDVPRTIERVFGRQGLDSRSFGFGYLAFYGYDVVQHIEDLQVTIPPRLNPSPDLTLVVYRGIALFDLVAGEATLTFVDGATMPDLEVDRILALLGRTGDHGRVESVPAPLEISDSTTPERFHDDVQTALGHIAIGDVYQVQLGHEIAIRSDIEELDVYRRLRERNPSPYMALIPLGDQTVISASPELFLRIEGAQMTMRPIAGTIARGTDKADDEMRKRTLARDEKEVAEHTMLVDLCRNDLSRVAKVDTVEVDELMVVENYSHVFHLVSNVKAQLLPGQDVQDVIAATFPAGTMTGAPKIRAMEIIEDVEDSRRELYAGAFGLIGFGGYVNLGLCIRTVFRSGSTYRTRASAGVVADSTPVGEWRETLSKLNAAYWAVTDEELL